MWKGEKIGGSDVVATVMGEEWLRWVIMKLGSRVVCDWERMWRVEGRRVRDEAREVMSWKVDPAGMKVESLRF